MTNKEIVKAFFVESYQNHRYDFAMKHMAVDYYDHSPAAARSNQEAVGILKVVEAMFSDLQIEVLDLIEEKDRVASRIKFTGIHTGICMGIKPTGKRIEFEALENFRLKDGVITESWGYWPDLSIKAFLEENPLEGLEDNR
ncbi:ester cyclase [Gorillibacterium timonense]|uniref:ester cyclase n=1 Tax=Gorillibacterium timonense TaxID=1689269 RepID=UPI00071C9BD5|nr:ester cyclase [Gorillibacterium timonense]